MKILFICTGNICRSPAAEAILQKLLADNQLSGIYVKSAGTHERDNCGRDETMVNIAKEYGYHMTGTSQTMTPDMLMEADLIIVMTERHYEDVTDLLDHTQWNKVHLFMEYCFNETGPLHDPWFGTEYLYRTTFRTIEKGCMNIIQKLSGKTEQKIANPNLMQLTKNLIMQAIYEFDRRFNVRQEFQQALDNNETYNFKVFSMWNNDSDEFYAGAFELMHLSNSDRSTLNIIIYSKYTTYLSECCVFGFYSIDEMLTWLRQEETPMKCYQHMERLLDNLNHL